MRQLKEGKSVVSDLLLTHALGFMEDDLCICAGGNISDEFLIFFYLTFLAAGSKSCVLFFFLGWLRDRRLGLAIRTRRVASTLYDMISNCIYQSQEDNVIP